MSYQEEGAQLQVLHVYVEESRLSMVVQMPHDLRVYATRWKPFLPAMIFAGVVVVVFLVYFVWTPPTLSWHPWQYQQPAATIVFVCVVLLCGTPVPLGLYWTFTSQPVLHVTPSSLVYHPFPGIFRTIYWMDVDDIAAHTVMRTLGIGGLYRITSLTISFVLKPNRISAYGGKQRVKMDIGLGSIPLSADELLERIGQCIASE